jgi:Ser/Thr protein kinase RdoA (MazF antagonist)
MDLEEPLLGGLVPGRVVRVGDTVRRPAGPWTPTIHALLRHIRAKGFPAPEPLGLDEKGREVVSFLEGEVSNWPWPVALRGDGGLRAVAAMLRAYHAAVADFSPPAGAVWVDGATLPGADEIILHGDFGPYNLVWRGARIVGVIDWDLARPGKPLADAAWAAIHSVPLRGDADTRAMGFDQPPNRRARLATFAEAFGGVTPSQLLAEALAVQLAMMGLIERLGNAGLEPWAGHRRHGLVEGLRLEHQWLLQAAPTLA